ncbi:MAG: DUF445 family protein [Tissierellia bacterium]|nr:DUF445 family protein [Tissierellia bacterium]
MNKIILNYLVQGILGGASGYITNEYAINMLFKEYTPLKLGGVIKKSRNEFIENLSSMIEKDIITQERLHEILNSKEFKINFEKLTENFFRESLYKTVGSNKFSDIDKIDLTMKATDKFVKKIIDQDLNTIVAFIVSNINLKDLITNTQSTKIVDSLYISTLDFLENTNILEKALEDLWGQNNLKLSDLLNGIPESIVYQFVEFSLKDPSFCELIKLTAIDDGINESLSVFYNKQIKDIVKLDNEAFTTLTTFINKRGQGYINDFCQSIFAYGKTLDISLLSLLDKSFEENLKNYLSKTLPYILDKVIILVENNSLLIDKIIEESIDQLVKTNNIKAKFLSLIKKIYFNKLNKGHFSHKIIFFIKQINPETLSESISDKIIESLNIAIKDIFILAENSNLDEKASHLLTSYIKNNLVNISEIYIKDILSQINFSIEKSQLPNKFLKDKSTAYIVNKLKTISFDEVSPDFTNKVGRFIKDQLYTNEVAIKNWAYEKVKDFDFSQNILKNLDLDHIKENSYSKYKENSSKLKDLKLQLLLDKLNLKHLSKNSAESLRTYLVNNKEVILKGSIKGIVSDNLNKLSDDEVVEFANDFIGRELKPIMFFGGVLGVIAGLILAVFQNAPLQPGAVNIANMLTYSFVGFITNVIAIKMIFKPYKENKFLAKIPFFRNFSLAYIVKNQKVFAENTAGFIDSTLLSKKSMDDLLNNHKDKIKNSFLKNIEKNKILIKLFRKNLRAAVNSSYSLFKNITLNNIAIFSKYLYGKISKIKISSISANTDKLSSLIHKELPSRENLTNSIYNLINSDKLISTKISPALLSKSLKNQLIKYYHRYIALLKGKDFKNQLLNYQDKYDSLTSKTFSQVFNLSNEDLHTISEKIGLNLINNCSETSLNILNKSRNNTFGELFNGKLIVYIDRNMPQITNILLNKFTNSLLKNKEKLSLSLRTELKNNSSFLEKSMFSIIGGDEIVDELLNIIISDKIPKFIDIKKDEIAHITKDLISERFYNEKYIAFNEEEVEKIIRDFLNIHKEKALDEFYNISCEIYEKIKNERLADLLNFFYIDSLESFLDKYEGEVVAFTSAVDLNNMEVYEKITAYISSVEKFADKSFKEVFYDLSYEDIEKILYSTVNKNHINNILKDLVDSYIDYHKNITLDYYIDKNEFTKASSEILQKFVKDSATEEEFKSIIGSIIQEAIDSNFNFIDTESKKYIANMFVDASIESLKNNLDSLLKSVEFHKIAKEEIEKMNPEKIHQMFNSFGEKYFKRLMVYGFGGFVFGINMYVGFSLTGLKILSGILKKEIE